MHKILFILSIIILFALISSCKKCMTCEIEFTDASNKEATRIMDECARKGKLDDFENTAKAVADSLGGTVICVTE